MFIKKEQNLNYYHLVFLIQSAMIGAGALSLPYHLSPIRHSIWIYPLIYGVLAQFFLWVYINLSKRYPDCTFFEITKVVFGKGVGTCINFIILLYILVSIVQVLVGYTELIQVNVLKYFSVTKILIVLFVVILYIGGKGIDTIARFCIVTFFVTISLFIFLWWPFSRGNLHILLPIINFDLSEFFKGLSDSFFSFFGFELILFIYPFFKYKEKVYKYASIGTWFSIFLIFLICFASAIYFSEWQLKNLVYPALNLYKSVEFSFIERIETFGVTLLVFWVITTTLINIWVFKLGFKFTFHLERFDRLIILLFLIITYVMITIPYSDALKRHYYDLSVKILALFTIIIPFITLWVDMIRRKVWK